MRPMSFVFGSVVLCCVLADVELYTGSFGPSFRSGLFPTTQDEQELWEEERDTEGEDRIIAKLAQIIREINTKYAPAPPSPPPQLPMPDFTYQFPEIDLSSIGRSSIPFAVRPNDPLFHQSDFAPNSKKQMVGSFGVNPSTGAARGSNPRTPGPRLMRPLVLLVKDDNSDEESDDTQDHLATPHQSHVANLHTSGHPQWGHQPQEVEGDRTGHHTKWGHDSKEVEEERTGHHTKWGHDSKEVEEERTGHHTKWGHDSKEVEADREGHRHDTQVYITRDDAYDDDNMYFVALVTGCSAALLLVISVGVYSWHKLQRNSKLGADVKYPAYSVGGVTKNGTPPTSGDRRLAHSAQMYHYQHQKQQILALENHNRDQRRGSLSDGDSDEDHDADHTVYECPTLPLTNKKTPDIEVKKPTVETKPTPSLPSSNTSDDPEKPVEKR